MSVSNRLLASIRSSIKMMASVANQTIINGSIQSYIVIKGSVVTFAKNLSIRGILTPIIELTAKVSIIRKAKAILTPIISMTARVKGIKNAKAILTANISMTANIKNYKNMIQTLYIRPIFGKLRLLYELDIFNLLPLDPQTLGDLEFIEGVRCSIVKNSKGIISPIINITCDAIMLRYTKLGDMDGFTLSIFDSNTLKNVQETIV